MRNWAWSFASPLALLWVFPSAAELPVKGRGQGGAGRRGRSQGLSGKAQRFGPASPLLPVLSARRCSVWATSSPLSKGPSAPQRWSVLRVLSVLPAQESLAGPSTLPGLGLGRGGIDPEAQEGQLLVRPCRVSVQPPAPPPATLWA